MDIEDLINANKFGLEKEILDNKNNKYFIN